MMKINQENKSEVGITLVALLITIIVLIILTAVTLININKNLMVEIATQGTQNYAKASVNEEKEMNNVANLVETTVDAINDIQKEEQEKDSGITILIPAYCSYIDETTATITVAAKSKDDGMLTYLLNWNNMTREANDDKQTKKSGETVVFTKNDIKNGETYSWNIDIIDENGNKEIAKNAKIYCKTTLCDEGEAKGSQCKKCEGKGSITETCGGQVYYTGEVKTGKWASKGYCSYCSKQMSVNSTYYSCEYACKSCKYVGVLGEGTACSKNHALLKYPSGTLRSVSCTRTITQNCTNCNKTGIVQQDKLCTHLKTEPHYYCEHGNSYTLPYHE